MRDVTVFKLVSIVCIWLVGITGGLLPSLVARYQEEQLHQQKRHKRQGQGHSPLTQHILSVLNAFSGGVFLAGGFFHLLHDAIENPALQRWSSMDNEKYAFPYAEMFCTMGFLGLLLLEQAAHARMAAPGEDAPVHDDSLAHDDSDTVTEDYVEDVDDDDDDQFLANAEAQGLTGASSSAYQQSRVKAKASPRQHSHTHSHGHSHMVGGGQSPAVALVLFVALSFHSVLEGLGIGAQSASAWGVFLAIVLHKGLAAFALGSGMVQSALPRRHVVLYMVLFSFMSIFGILAGWVIAADESEDSAAAGICVALASGTFIYVAVMEVIPQEFPRHAPSAGNGTARSAALAARQQRQKTVALCLGYALFGMLAKWS